MTDTHNHTYVTNEDLDASIPEGARVPRHIIEENQRRRAMVTPQPKGKIELYLESSYQRLNMLAQVVEKHTAQLRPIMAPNDVHEEKPVPEEEQGLCVVALTLHRMDEQIRVLIEELENVYGRVQV